MSEPINGDELIAKIQPKLREVRTQICLRPDLVAEWTTLNDQLKEKQQTSSARMTPRNRAGMEELAEQIVALEQQIEDASVWCTFRALPAAKYRALCADYPPREDNQMDQVTGHDRDAVSEQLIRRCLVDPVFTDKGYAQFMEACAPSEWAELRDAVYEANGGSATPPKSVLASQVLSKRARASASPKSGG